MHTDMGEICDHPRVLVGGLKTARLSRRDLIAQMVADCANARVDAAHEPKLVFTANGHSVALAATNAKFRRLLEEADVLHADGQPIVFASRLLTDTPIPERSATTDFIYDAADAAARHGLRFFLLGGTEDVNAQCALDLRRMYPGLIVAGRRNGYFRRNEEIALCDTINRSGADIVWVGLGVPQEQEFCSRNRAHLTAGWLITSGGCFNFVTGDYKRAPRWMQAIGLEWLHRLWCEPGRLWRRYALTNPLAAFLLLISTASLSGLRK
jgi:exopolysaccharide biosynthesis WecB/TagA/CpsF family protein